jgi:hypothetical protein
VADRFVFHYVLDETKREELGIVLYTKHLCPQLPDWLSFLAPAGVPPAGAAQRNLGPQRPSAGSA